MGRGKRCRPFLFDAETPPKKEGRILSCYDNQGLSGVSSKNEHPIVRACDDEAIDLWNKATGAYGLPETSWDDSWEPRDDPPIGQKVIEFPLDPPRNNGRRGRGRKRQSSYVAFKSRAGKVVNVYANEADAPKEQSIASNTVSKLKNGNNREASTVSEILAEAGESIKIGSLTVSTVNPEGQSFIMKEVVKALSNIEAREPEQQDPFKFSREPKRVSQTPHKGPYISQHLFTSLYNNKVEQEDQQEQKAKGICIQSWLEATPDKFEKTAWERWGFLALPPEIRNKIYAHLLEDLTSTKYEIVLPEIENPHYVPKYDFSDAQRAILMEFQQGMLSSMPKYDDVKIRLGMMARERKMLGKDKPIVSDANSTTAWRLRTPEEYEEIEEDENGFRADGLPAPPWTKNNVKPDIAHELRESGKYNYVPLTKTTDQVHLRRELAQINKPAKRLAIMDRAGGPMGIAALGLTCKLVSEEWLSLLYSKLEFGFSQPRATLLFLRNLRPGKAPIACIKSIHLRHQHRYGEVHNGHCLTTEAREWRDNEAEFQLICQEMARLLPNLRQLDVTVDAHEAHLTGRSTFSGRYPEGHWREFYKVSKMESAPWFQPIKAFRKCAALKHATITYQPDPNVYTWKNDRRLPVELAFSRLLLVGPERLREEYAAGVHDGFLQFCGKATYQIYPIFGPLTEEQTKLEQEPKPPQRRLKSYFDSHGMLVSRWISVN